MKVAIITGTRPQFIKLAPIIDAFDDRNIETFVINTGQHYDFELAEAIIYDLSVNIDTNLHVGSNSHATQTSDMIEALESYFNRYTPDIVVVIGDTNSTLAGALVSVKLKIPVIHLEAGLRSGDWNMPEEINRIITDRISSLLFTTTVIGYDNLLTEGIDQNFIVPSGDTTVDSIRKIQLCMDDIVFPKAFKNKILLATIHRPETVDNVKRLEKAIEIFGKSELPVMFFVHPRTKSKMDQFNLLEKAISFENLLMSPPVGYIKFISYLSKCAGILTDSGGIQKEAFILRKPCITLRTTTEWQETIQFNANRLLDLDVNLVLDSIKDIETGNFVVDTMHPYGNGKAAIEIVDEIIKRWEEGRIILANNIRRKIQ